MNGGGKLHKTLSAAMCIFVVCILISALVFNFGLVSYADDTGTDNAAITTGDSQKTKSKTDKEQSDASGKTDVNEAAKGQDKDVSEGNTDNSSEDSAKQGAGEDSKTVEVNAALSDTASPKNADQKNADRKKNEKKKGDGAKAVHNDVITKIEALLQDGSGSVGDVQQWQVFRLNAEFDLSGKDVKAGDTTTITLPEKLRFHQTAGFEIKDSSGNVVANAVINGGDKTITLTYTDYAENHSEVHGDFFFYVKIDRDKVDGPEDITLQYDVDGNTIIGDTIHFVGIGEPTGRYLSKSGYQTGNDKRTIQFQIAINTIQQPISNLVLTDQLENEGFTIIPDSFEIRKGKWQAVHGDWQMPGGTYQVVTDQYNIVMGEDGRSFSIDMGNISAEDGFYVYYKARASYDLVDGEVIRNTASVNGTESGSNPQTVETTYYEAGGSAEGYVYGIKVIKQDEKGDPLAGAVFSVIRESNGVVAGTITTDATGEGSVSGLLKDDYRLVEVTPPAGYELLQEPVLVSASDFGSDKIAIKTVENKAITIDIPVKKQWVGDPAKSAVIDLIADGVMIKEAELSDDNGWEYTFRDLPQYDSSDGHEIAYTVQEQNIEGYVSGISGTAENGFTITNTIAEKVSVPVTKVWEGPKTDKVSVSLLANGVKADTVVLSEENNWQYTFTELEKYKDGKEINYTVEEEPMDNYTTHITGNAQSGYTIKNINVDKRDVNVVKKWIGEPLSKITVRLIADGKEIASVDLTKSNNWKHSFTDLPAYAADGHKIDYSVKEDNVEGYTSEITGSAVEGFTITNKKTEEKPDPDKTIKEKTDSTDDSARKKTENKTKKAANKTKTKGAIKSSVPKTGDPVKVSRYIMVILAALMTIAVVNRIGKKY